MTVFRTVQNPAIMRGVAESGLFEKKVGGGRLAPRIGERWGVRFGVVRYEHALCKSHYTLNE